MSDSGNNGDGLVALSCNALVPELAEDRPLVAHVVEAMIFMISGALAPDVGTIFSHAVNISMTRRAYKLLAVLFKSNSEAGRASWQFSDN